MEKKRIEDLEKKTLELQTQSLELTGKLRATEDGNNQLEPEVISLKNQIWEIKTDIQQQQKPVDSNEEEELIKRKMKNAIIFGLEDNGNEESQIKTLFDDIGVASNLETDLQGTYRVGRSTSKRPVILQFAKQEQRDEVLAKAKKLKGKTGWRGVAITEDLTKKQCQEERNREYHLREEAQRRNELMSGEQKKYQIWKPIGGRGRRHLLLQQLRESEEKHPGPSWKTNISTSSTNNSSTTDSSNDSNSFRNSFLSGMDEFTAEIEKLKAEIKARP